MNTVLNRLRNRVKWSIRKNQSDLRGIFLREYPEFVLSQRPKLSKGTIPVFVFHQVEPKSFEEKLVYLIQNHYVTLNADDFYEYLTGSKVNDGREILLTFDDGSISLWSIAYPLLKKYSLKAVSFILPGLIRDEDRMRPNLEDVWQGHFPLNQVPMEKNELNPLCNWKEIEEMHRSGVIDFQSHTMYHDLIPVGRKVIDFFNPNFETYYFGNIFVPMYREGNLDLIERRIRLGTPIYEAEPRMSPFPRFFDDEKVREKCQRFVEEEGAVEFFKKGWRKKMESFFQKAKKESQLNERFESAEEQKKAIGLELQESKAIIENRLNKKVVHLCYPWFIGSNLSIEQSVQSGYKTNFWGTIPGIRENRIGSNPFKIVRLEERFIFRLPGEGRKSLIELIEEKFSKYAKLTFFHSMR